MRANIKKFADSHKLFLYKLVFLLIYICIFVTLRMQN